MANVRIDDAVREMLARAELEPSSLLGRSESPTQQDPVDRPDASDADGALAPGRPDEHQPAGAMLVHNDHRIVINYNASGLAARHRALTRPDAERERTGSL